MTESCHAVDDHATARGSSARETRFGARAWLDGPLKARAVPKTTSTA